MSALNCTGMVGEGGEDMSLVVSLTRCACSCKQTVTNSPANNPRDTPWRALKAEGEGSWAEE